MNATNSVNGEMSTETTELLKSQDVTYEAADPSLAALGFKYSSLMSWGVAPQSKTTPAANTNLETPEAAQADASQAQDTSSAVDAAGQTTGDAAAQNGTLHGFEETATQQNEADENLVTAADIVEEVGKLRVDYKNRGLSDADIDKLTAGLSGAIGKRKDVLKNLVADAKAQFDDLGREADQNFDDRLDMIQEYWEKTDRLSEKLHNMSQELDNVIDKETKEKRDELENQRQQLVAQRGELAKEQAKLKAELDAASSEEERDAILKKLNAVNAQLQQNNIQSLSVKAEQKENYKQIIEQTRKNPASTDKQLEVAGSMEETLRQMDEEDKKMVIKDQSVVNQVKNEGYAFQNFQENESVQQKKAIALNEKITTQLEASGQSNANAPLTAENKVLKQKLEASKKEMESKEKEVEARAKKTAEEAEAKAAKKLESTKQVAQNDFKPESASLDDLGDLPLPPKAKQKTTLQEIS